MPPYLERKVFVLQFFFSECWNILYQKVKAVFILIRPTEFMSICSRMFWRYIRIPNKSCILGSSKTTEFVLTHCAMSIPWHHQVAKIALRNRFVHFIICIFGEKKAHTKYALRMALGTLCNYSVEELNTMEFWDENETV